MHEGRNDEGIKSEMIITQIIHSRYEAIKDRYRFHLKYVQFSK